MSNWKLEKEVDLKQMIASRLMLQSKDEVINTGIHKQYNNTISIFTARCKDALIAGYYFVIVDDLQKRDGVKPPYEYDFVSKYDVGYIPPDVFTDYEKWNAYTASGYTTYAINHTKYIGNGPAVQYDISKEVVSSLSTEGGSREFEKLSQREYACVLLRVPRSGTKWIDELIRISHKQETMNKHKI